MRRRNLAPQAVGLFALGFVVMLGAATFDLHLTGPSALVVMFCAAGLLGLVE